MIGKYVYNRGYGIVGRVEALEFDQGGPEWSLLVSVEPNQAPADTRAVVSESARLMGAPRPLVAWSARHCTLLED